MKFAIFSNGQRFTNVADSFEADIREMVVAEEVGFEEVWISEHTAQPWLPYGMPATELMICKAAALTRRIRFGPAVRRLALYPPQMVALEGAVCDQLTGGRYSLGYGVGPKFSNYEQWGLDPEEAGARTVESLELVRKCWNEPEPFDFEGRFYKGKGISIYPKTRQPRIPIAVATGNEQMLDLAGKEGFRLLTTWSAHPEAVRRIGANFDQACVNYAGQTRRRDVVGCRIVYVAQTDEAAHRDVEKSLRYMLDSYGKSLGPAASQFTQSGRAPSTLKYDSMLQDGNIILGSPATVAAGIRQFFHGVGGFGTFMLVAGRDFTSEEKIHTMYRLFAESVVPKLADLDLQLDTVATAQADRVPALA